MLKHSSGKLGVEIYKALKDRCLLVFASNTPFFLTRTLSSVAITRPVMEFHWLV